MRYHTMFAVGAAAVVAAGGLAATPAGAMSKTVVVHPGQSIQAAVDAAAPGTTIKILAGVYRESVGVSTPGLTLEGSGSGPTGTVLEAEGAVATTSCVAVGVCVAAPRVRVTGIRTDGYFVGVAVAGPSDGVVDAPGASQVILDHDTFTGSLLGLAINDVVAVDVGHDQVQGNCQGILVQDVTDGAGPSGILIHDNDVSANNKLCTPDMTGGGTWQGGGMTLFGVTDSAVVGNRVDDNVGAGDLSGGILVVNVAAKNIVVSGNEVRRNQPADLIWDGAGTSIHFLANDCRTSQPAGLCRHG